MSPVIEPQLRLGNLQCGFGDAVAEQPRPLEAAMQRVFAGAGVVFAGDAARLQRVGGDAVDDEALLDHVRGAREGRVGRRLVAGLVEIRLVVRAIVVELRRAGLERLARRHHRGTRRVVHGHALGRVPRKIERVGDHHRHRIADMHRPADRDGGAERQGHRAAVALLVGRHRRHRAEAVGAIVLAGQHGVHAGHLQRGARIDAADVGVGVRRAHDRGVKLAGELEIVVVAPAAGEQARVFAPPHRLTDRKFAHESCAAADALASRARERVTRLRTGRYPPPSPSSGGWTGKRAQINRASGFWPAR